MLFKFKEFLIEKSIGSENIRTKWYSDLDKKEFYKLINVDPTSIRKKDFSKPGKYSKWLLYQYKKEREYFEKLVDEEFLKKLNYFLFIFSTQWFKNKAKKENLSIDINKYDLTNFITMMYRYVEDYEKESEDSKYDVVYSDEKVNILIPMNFSASYETAKNTEWCTQQYTGYSMWNKIAILFRIIPKIKGYDKLKLTWSRFREWNLACSKYPEISGNDSPFDIVNGEENWIYRGNNSMIYSEKAKNNFEEIKKTMSLLDDNAKQLIMRYYDMNKRRN